MPEQAARWLARLGDFLSPAQLHHVRRFANIRQQCLRIISRLLALRFCNCHLLGSNRNGLPFFPCHNKHVAFSYTLDHAFCALCSSSRIRLNAFAADAVDLAESEEKQIGLIDWFSRFPLVNAQRNLLLSLNSLELNKLWLLQECFSKIYGFNEFYSSFPRIFTSFQICEDIFSCSPDFHARFLAQNSFLVCIASNADIFIGKELSSCSIFI